jgi:peptidoglycan/xylan/chitin deacetylase (PgdA/CDA1 family)
MFLGASAFLGGAGTAVYYATYAVRTQWLGRTVWCGRTDTRSVALTFDDGPGPDTEPMLDTLDACGVRAAFFMVGQQVQRHPHIARQVVARGHVIGNHSYSHPIYLYRSRRETYEQLARAQDVIADVTGVRPTLSRPPCGVRTRAYFDAAHILGLRTVQWTVAALDWKRRTAESIAQRVVEHAAPGAIILLHDGDSAGKHDRQATVAAIPGIVEGLRRRGLRVTTLTQLIDWSGEVA